MTRRISWGCALLAAVGLAFVMAVVLLLLTATAGKTPTASALSNTVNWGALSSSPSEVTSPCQLSISKRAEEDTVSGDNEITYDITVTNIGTTVCFAVGLGDRLPDQLRCDSTEVVDADGMGFSANNDCLNNHPLWIFLGNPLKGKGLTPGHSIEVRVMAHVEGAEEGDEIVNRSCAIGRAWSRCSLNDCSDSLEDPEVSLPRAVCDTASVEVVRQRHHAPTATPTAQPTATATPVTVLVPPTPTPKASPAAVLAPPNTGTGPESGGTSWALPIGLAISGLGLVGISGGAMVKRRLR
jgi:uncharacterized repeat protein (TIGR01451 family)